MACTNLIPLRPRAPVEQAQEKKRLTGVDRVDGEWLMAPLPIPEIQTETVSD